MLKKIVIRLLWIMATAQFILWAVAEIFNYYWVTQGIKVLENDAYILQQILEDENCLSNDYSGSSTRYSDFVNYTLRTSETSIFKYDIVISKSGKAQNNPDLYTSNWKGIESAENPVQVDETSYLSCPQRGEVVTASLTLNVYAPCIVRTLVTKDSYSQMYNRKLTKVTQDIEVLGRKYYKGKMYDVTTY